KRSGSMNRSPARLCVLWLYPPLWAAGLGGIWWLVPSAPRDGWQPAAGEFPAGFLQDGRTVVTLRHYSSFDFACPDPVRPGPVCLRDVASGRLRAVHFGPQDAFECFHVLGKLDLLQVWQRVRDPGKNSLTLRLRLLDAWTAREVASFLCEANAGPAFWVVAPD